MRISLAGCPCCIGRLRYTMAANQSDHVHIGRDNQAVLKHALNCAGRRGDLLFGIDDGDHNREVPGGVEETSLVLVPLGSVAEDPPANSSARGLETAAPPHGTRRPR